MSLDGLGGLGGLMMGGKGGTPGWAVPDATLHFQPKLSRFYYNGRVYRDQAAAFAAASVAFSRSSVAWYRDASGVWQDAATNELRLHHDENGNPLGWLLEGSRTNKTTCRKRNPTDTTNLTKGDGDVTTTLTVVDDPAALAAAGLGVMCNTGKVYKLDNSAAATFATVTFGGQVGNLNPHTMTIYWRGSGQGRVNLDGQSAADLNIPAAYARSAPLTQTPGATDRQMKLTVSAGAVVYFILPQLEEGNFASPDPIVDETDGLAAVTRAADSLTRTVSSPAEYSVVLEAIASPGAGAINQALWSLYGDGNNYETLLRTSARVLNGFITVSSSTVGAIPLSALVADSARFRCGVAREVDDYRGCYNGVLSIHDDDVASLPSVTTEGWGRWVSSAVCWDGVISEVIAFDKRISDARLQQLTSSDFML